MVAAIGRTRSTALVPVDRHATNVAVPVRPLHATVVHDATRGASSIGTPPRPTLHASRVPDEVRRTVQGAGGVVRGLGTAGSDGVKGIVRSAPFKFGRVPGAAILSGGFAAYETYRSYERSGLGKDTVRTAARGIGGVAGAYVGGSIGATIGAAGGPVGAVVGGAIGAVIGGYVGGKVGQGAADAFYAATGFLGHVSVADTSRHVEQRIADGATGLVHEISGWW